MFPALDVPETLGSYKVLGRLPNRGQAGVYLARSQGPMGFQRECELKIMPDASDGEAAFAEELAREAAICAKLNHPAIVRVFDFFAYEENLVLVMEHPDGETLTDLLKDSRERLPDIAAMAIGARIAGALADAHAARDEEGNPTPIVHRNIQPDSVVISTDGDIRLAGFGIGKIIGRTPDTQIGRIKGTPGYMAPEQARGEVVTPKTDVYGLGLLTWSLLTGQRPPTDGTWPRRISSLRSDLPRETSAVIEAALDHFPGTRKITAREIEQWLTKAAPLAKAKPELKQRVAALRAARDAASKGPASVKPRVPPTTASPYAGVSFGALGKPAPSATPPPPNGTAPIPARVRTGSHQAPPSQPGASPVEPRGRTATATGLGKVTLALPSSDDAPEPAPVLRAPDAPRAADAVLLGPVMPLPPPASPSPTKPLVVPAPKPPRPPSAPTFGAPPVKPTAAPEAVIEDPPTEVVLAAGAVTPPPPRAPSVAITTEQALNPADPRKAMAPMPPAALPSPATPSAPSTPSLSSMSSMSSAPAMSSLAGPDPAPPPAPPVVVAPPPVARPAPSLVDARLSSAALPPPRAPMPSLLTTGPGRRALSPLGAAVVSAITSTFVVGVALYGFTRRDRTDPAPAVTVTVHEAAAPPSATAAPASTSAASASASSSASATIDPKSIPFGFGLLTVDSPADATVFVSGKRAGPVNTPLRVRCGRWFVRLAAPDSGRFPEWVSEGDTVVVPCQDAVRLEPHNPPIKR